MPDFIPGLPLSELFYHEAVRPILNAEYPGITHSAALIGYGSEVLGYDTERSTDHEWGPRLLLFLSESDYEQYSAQITETLRWKLPTQFKGYSTHFGPTEEEGTLRATEKVSGPVDHKVGVHTVGGFLEGVAGVRPTRGLEVADWLSLPQQRLLEVTGGRVFHDGLGELEPVRKMLAFYPHDVWLLVMAGQWRRVAQMEAFVGRTAEVGDELGSRLVAAGLVRDVMRLLFLMERKYAPYSKWFGTAFGRLKCAPRIGPMLDGVMMAGDWREREGYLVEAYEAVAEMHNALNVTPPLDTQATFFFGRPFRVLFADRFVDALHTAIADPQVKATKVLFGSVDQVSDNTDVLSYPQAYRKLRALYD